MTLCGAGHLDKRTAAISFYNIYIPACRGEKNTNSDEILFWPSIKKVWMSYVELLITKKLDIIFKTQENCENEVIT